MTPQEVKESNKLIAKFMGYREVDEDKFTRSRTGQIEKLACDFDYDCRWDDLMPVVEKIESLGYFVKISTKSSMICEGNHFRYPAASSMFQSKIENTYLVVISFIKHQYNKNKNK